MLKKWILTKINNMIVFFPFDKKPRCEFHAICHIFRSSIPNHIV